MERRLAAILLTDMVDYSRLIGLDEAGTLARQSAHREEIFDPKRPVSVAKIKNPTYCSLLIRSKENRSRYADSTETHQLASREPGNLEQGARWSAHISRRTQASRRAITDCTFSDPGYCGH